jgi:hypothetical protein
MSETAAALEAIDKSTWGDGPWQTEPDRLQWQHAGYACLIVRHPRHGFLCGYVGVDSEHPYFGENWREFTEHLQTRVDVNYSDKCGGAVCHVPEPGMPANVWWIGFDCGHAFDVAPALNARERALGMPEFSNFSPQLRPRYKTVEYVKAKCEELARELRALAT